MKRLWTALLALLLAAMLPGAALAAAGDAEIRGMGGELETEYNDATIGACALDGRVYICGMRHIFVYDPAGGELTAAPLMLALGEDEYAYPVGIASDGEMLYLLVPVYYAGEDEYSVDRLELVPAEVDGEEVVLGEPLEIDADDLIVRVEDMGSYFADVPGCCWVGGYLMLCVDDGAQRRAYAIDPEGGCGWYVDVPAEGVRAIAPYGEDRALIACCDGGAAALYLYDPAEDELEEAARAALESDAENLFAGLAHSEESGRLFYLDGGSLMAAEGLDLASARQVASLSVREYVQSTGLLLPGDLYAYNAGYEGVVFRATEGRGEIAARLTVQGTYCYEASAQVYSDFAAAHGDVEVVMNAEAPESEAVIEAMMNRDPAVDVYLLPVASEAYDALYARDFLVPLEDAGIIAAVEGMYPAVRAAITKGGEVVALPVYAGGETVGLDYEGFEKAGISREEVPDNWTELLEFLPEVQKKLPEGENIFVFDGYSTQLELRASLLREILRSWRDGLAASGEEVSYDDPALAEALEALLALDLDALDVPRDEAEAEELWDALDDAPAAGRPYRLVEAGIGCAFGEFYSLYEPAPLAVAPGGEGHLPLELTVAVVNPYSEHIGLAQEFVAALMRDTSVAVMYCLSDTLNEPVPYPRTERVREETRAEIERLRGELADAEAVDAPAIEAEIAERERELASIDEFGMLISEGNIEWYRSRAEGMVVERFDYLNEDDALADLTAQLLSGRMKPANFLKEVDKKARMRRMEGH